MMRNEAEIFVNKYFRRHRIKAADGKLLACPPERTIRQYFQYKIIPGASGSTRAADYPDWTPAELAAVLYLQDRGWLVGRLYSARVSIGWRLERGLPVVHELDRFWEENSPCYSDGVEWAINVLKVHCDCPLGTPATIVETVDELTGTTEYLAMPPIKREGEHPGEIDRLISGDKLG